MALRSGDGERAKDAERGNGRFSALLTLAFAAIVLVGILNHAMWRDEVNPWLIVRDSVTMADMFAAIHYEGHPPLWYLLLRPLSLLTHDPRVMQLLHLAIATATIAVFARFAPFSPAQKILFSLGYLPFYEYALISRNYAIGLFLAVLFCAVFARQRQAIVAMSLILVLMANASAFGLFLALALGLALALDELQIVRHSRGAPPPVLPRIVAAALFLAGVGIALYFMIQPPDSQLAGGPSGWFLQFDLHQAARAVGRIWNGYVAVLVFSDSRLLDALIFAALSLGLFALFAGALRHHKPAAAAYLVGTAIIVGFAYVRFAGGPRHYGHHFVLLLAALWIADSLARRSGQPGGEATWGRWPSRVLWFLLICQAAAGVVAFSRDMIVPYSAGRAAAAHLQAQLPVPDGLVVASPDFVMAPVSAYLGRRLHYPQIGREGSYTLFTADRQSPSQEEILAWTESLMDDDEEAEALLVLNTPLLAVREGLDVTQTGQFTHALMQQEHYFVYRLTRRPENN